MVNATARDFMGLPLLEAQTASAGLQAFRDVHEARADWNELFAASPASPYQAHEFARVWFETIGSARGLQPMIVVARAENRQPIALLPFAVERRGPLRIGVFLGGKESNFNLGLFRRDAAIAESDIAGWMRQAARAERVDLFHLRNQPTAFDGHANPLLALRTNPSASFAYGTALPSTASELDARFSGDARKKLRKKQARLEKLGALAFEHAAQGARAQEIAEGLVAQKAMRLREAKIDESFDLPEMRDFVSRLAAAEGAGALETHALTLDGRIIAAYAGLAHEGRFSALLNSFDMDEEIARSSPGDLLLHALLRDLVARGFTRFDLGVGEARYKNAICEETIEMFEAIYPTSFTGAIAAPLFIAAARAKRKIKQTPWMLRSLARLRGLRACGEKR